VPAPENSAKNVGPAGKAAAAVSAAKALATAAQNVGEPTTEQQVAATQKTALAGDPEQSQKLQAPGLLGQSDASLVWFPMSKNELRLCWEIILTSSSRSEMFRLLVDAQSSEVLYRQCLTAYLTDISLRVYT